jgi:hypothetical protein
VVNRADELIRTRGAGTWYANAMDELGNMDEGLIESTGTGRALSSSYAWGGSTSESPDCSGWTDGGGQGEFASLVGRRNGARSVSTLHCSFTIHKLLCAQVDRLAWVGVPTQPHRNVFATTPGMPSSQYQLGPGFADHICTRAAQRAQLPGNYRALVATTSTSLVSTLTSGLPWARSDGVVLADSPEDFLVKGNMADDPDAIWAGFPIGVGVVYTGANGSVDQPGTSDTTCGDWSIHDPAVFSLGRGWGMIGTAGLSSLSVPAWLLPPRTCDLALSTFYCFEQ